MNQILKDQILGPLKTGVKKLPYPILLRAYYAAYFASHWPKFAIARRLLNISLFNELDTSTIKTSDTVFILASGSSINDISDEKWNGISAHDSFGFNFWLVHPHTPTLYVFEAIDPSIRNGFGAEVIAKYHEVQRVHEDRYEDVPKIVGDLSPERMGFIRELPAGWKENLYTLPSIPALARNASELEQNLKFLDELGVFAKTKRISRVFKYRASLSKMISLAVMMGYEKIVLCGVDLVHSEYFYQDAERYPRMAEFRSSRPTSKHTTSIPKPMLCSINTTIEQMEKQVLDPRGIELYVENPTSGLHPALPVAPEEIFTGS